MFGLGLKAKVHCRRSGRTAACLLGVRLGFLSAFALFGLLLSAFSTASVETFVEAPGPAGPLKGTMLSPKSGHGPMVLIIPGSGATDRDGNSGSGLKAAPYKLLAEGLVERGISTVRFDKRGMYASRAAVADANSVTIDDYAADVRAWMDTIRRKMRTPCVWLLGHSEGGLVALVAGKNSRDICGLVLVSAAGRPLSEVLREQLRSNPANAPVLDQALEAIAALEAGKRFDTANMNPALLPLFRPQVQDFLINEFSYDPAKLVATFAKPVLILQGQRDIQINEQDARRLHEANPRAKLVLLSDTNHVLKSITSDDRAANIATYSNPSLPLAPGVVNAIGDFIGTR